MMRDTDGFREIEPQPGLADLDALTRTVRSAGVPVELETEGLGTPLPRALDLSAYRIVQEALTNTLKHAHASQADVTVRYAPHHVELEVRDDGEGAMSNGGAGHGLVGIRERVKIYGGQMTAGPATDGGFLLTARLPVERTRP
jgi:signal transduction histidine kinase